ncbi:NAD(P)-binding protein [Lepidopterella palustris CBS 459.81]|uniref:NAD(P)-binding protein n=1 Tax=Lepidopterella palustris CBS 459.81 TaxID=1314670 RepID=A0A8E2EKT3_9PEZI|nr:NAD(P)-binding protein [Lepidopterella palustris CBS 459.81]
MPKTADNLLTGRLALVTGASGGIGAAIAHELILREVDLALTYSSSREAVESLVTQLKDVWERKYGVHIIKNECPVITIHQADLASADQTVKLCQDVNEKHGRPVDILIANAGYGKRIQDIWDISLDEFEHTLNVNLRAPFLLAKGVVGGMKAQGWGRIVFVSSIAAYGAGINGCHYAASKGGMMGMMKNLASRLAEHGITVNDVAPAMIGRTGMIPNESTVPGLVNTIPVGRLGTPKEVADAVLMFCTNGYTTGQSLVISGGLRHH